MRNQWMNKIITEEPINEQIEKEWIKFLSVWDNDLSQRDIDSYNFLFQKKVNRWYKKLLKFKKFVRFLYIV